MRTRSACRTDAHLLVTLLAIFLPTPDGSGCLWDTDTLKAEAAGRFDVVSTAVGYFNIYPASYYEMRLERVTEALKTDPGNLPLYDDAAVACDRLGRQDDAITWIGKKRSMMTLVSAPLTGDLPDHKYRALANLGTFHAHRWIKSRSRDSNLDDLRIAIQHISEAINSNSSAHFGREGIQLEILQWILREVDPSTRDRRPVYPDFSRHRADPIQSFCALIQLGAAWESIDAFLLLAHLIGPDHQALQLLALLRAEELMTNGSSSIISLPRLPFGDQTTNQIIAYKKALSAWQPSTVRFFQTARRACDDRREAMWAYMKERFRKNRHPDTDAAFWDDWVPPKMPVYPDQL